MPDIHPNIFTFPPKSEDQTPSCSSYILENFLRWEASLLPLEIFNAPKMFDFV